MRNINRCKTDRKVRYFVRNNKNSFIAYLKWNLNNRRRNTFTVLKCPDFIM